MSKKNKNQIWQKKRKRIKYRIMQKNIANLPPGKFPCKREQETLICPVSELRDKK